MPATAYTATNYSMGAPRGTCTVLAYSDDEAAKLAESALPGAHAQPGTVGGSRGHTRVIGLRKVKR